MSKCYVGHSIMYLYPNMSLSVMLDSLLCSFTLFVSKLDNLLFILCLSVMLDNLSWVSHVPLLSFVSKCNVRQFIIFLYFYLCLSVMLDNLSIIFLYYLFLYFLCLSVMLDNLLYSFI